MRYGSICSGIEAATVAWHGLGWEPAFFSEIDNFPRAVLQHHYPNVPLHGDFTTINGDEYGHIDLLVGGTPCQDFSVAGLRAGFAGERGNLTLEFARLVDRMRPQWIVWENVPGVLSIDGGRAFGSFLGALAEIGYGFAYRILDAQYCGVPQRRRRVFVVGHFGNWRRAAAVLFERESLLGHPAPRREAGEKVAGCFTSSPSSARSPNEDTTLIPSVVGTLTAKGPEARGAPEIDAGHYIVEQRPADVVPFDTTQITSVANYSRPKAGDPCHPLAAGAHPPAIAFEWQRGATQNLDMHEDFSPALIKSQTPAVAFQSSQPGVRVSDVHATLDSNNGSRRRNGVLQPLAFDLRGREGGAQFEGPHDTATAVRRLTPRECERLQGFSDDYTLVPYRNKPASDGPRYKALGNSMAVPVMRWIGKRIELIETLTKRIV